MKSAAWLLAGIYFLLSFFTLFSAAYFLEYPRLSEDSVIYANKAKSWTQEYSRNSEAAKSLRDQFSGEISQKEPDKELLEYERYRARFGAHLEGIGFPLWDVLSSIWTRDGVPVKWSVFLSETMVLVIFALSMVYFFFSLGGWSGVFGGILLVSVAYFSGHGIHSMVPSVLALGLGLVTISWAYSVDIKNLMPKRIILSCLFTVGAAFSHPVFLVYFCVAVALLGIRSVFLKEGASLRDFLLLAVFAGLASIVPLLFLKYNPELISPMAKYSQTRLSLREVFDLNFPRALQRVTSFLSNNAVILMFGIVGLFGISKKGAVLLGLSFLMLLASLFHNLSSHPGELFMRLMVLPVFVLVVFSCSRVLQFNQKLGILCMVLVFLGHSFLNRKYLKNEIFRGFAQARIFYDEKFSEAQELVAPGKAIVYFLSDHPLKLATYWWAKKHPVLALETYKDSEELESALNGYKPAIAITQHPPFLDSVSLIRPYSYRKRHLGIALDLMKSLKIKQCEFGTMILEVKNFTNEPAVFEILETKETVHLEPGKRAHVSVSGRESTLINKSGKTWIIGMRDKPEFEQHKWPWLTACRVVFESPKTQRQLDQNEFGFKFEEYFRENGELELYKQLSFSKVLSDTSGLVLLELR